MAWKWNLSLFLSSSPTLNRQYVELQEALGDTQQRGSNKPTYV